MLRLHLWLLEAAETERRLPPAIRRLSYSSWPDVLIEWGEYTPEVTHVSLGKASNDQVDRYDRMMGWVLLLPEASDRNLLWAAAHSAAFRSRGPAWAKLARLMHCDRRTVKRKYEQALMNLYYFLKCKKTF